MKELLFVGIGGALGAVARHALSGKVSSVINHPFPHGTLLVNSIGALALGFLIGTLDAKIVPESLRPLVGSGFLGAFTTFSTLSVETMALLRTDQWKLGILNVFLHLAIGLTCAIVGLISAEKLFGQ